MWKIVAVRQGEEQKYLDNGWEPFAAVPEIHTNQYIDSATHQKYSDTKSTTMICLRKEER